MNVDVEAKEENVDVAVNEDERKTFLPRTNTEAERQFQQALKNSSNDEIVRRSSTLGNTASSEIIEKAFQLLKTDDKWKESNDKVLLFNFCDAMKTLEQCDNEQRDNNNEIDIDSQIKIA